MSKVSKVVFGNDTVMDITDSTVNSSNLLSGEIAYGSDGERVVGAAVIPTVNDGTLTIQQNGTTKGTFTANQSGDTTVNILDQDVLLISETVTTYPNQLTTVIRTFDSGVIPDDAILSLYVNNATVLANKMSVSSASFGRKTLEVRFYNPTDSNIDITFKVYYKRV